MSTSTARNSSPRPRRPSKAKSVSIYLEDDNRIFLDLAAQDRDRSRSYLINLIVREHRRRLSGGGGAATDVSTDRRER